MLGTLGATATFVIFYLMTVFALSWGTTALHYSRQTFLLLQLFAIVFFGLTIPLAAILGENKVKLVPDIAVSGDNGGGLVNVMLARLIAGDKS